MTLFDRVFNGNDYNYERTVKAIDEAIAQYGAAEPVAFPDTAYNLPCYYSITGKKITNLGELKTALEQDTPEPGGQLLSPHAQEPALQSQEGGS